MAEEEIPENLIVLQQRFDAAHAAVVAASRRPGAVATWPPEAVEDLQRLQAAELAAVMELYRARVGTPFERYEHVKRLQEAAREGGGTAR